MTVSPHLIGIGAGLVAASLFSSMFASLVNSSMLAVVLFYLTPLPILLAGIGWGVRAAQLAFATAALLLAVILNLTTAIGFGLYIGLPSVVLPHLMLLRREIPHAAPGAITHTDSTPGLEWYPLGRIIAWAALMAGALVALGLVMLGGDGEGYRHAVKSVFDENTLKQLQNIVGTDFSKEQFDRLVDGFTRYLPPFLGGFWLLILLVNLWLAGKSAAISGQLARPAPNFAELDYPPLLLAGFAAAAALTFASGLLGLAGTAFLGAFASAYLILGLAIVHVIAAGFPLRLLVLGLLYTGLLLTPWVAPILVLLGLAEPFLQLRRRLMQRPAPPASRAGPQL